MAPGEPPWLEVSLHGSRVSLHNSRMSLHVSREASMALLRLISFENKKVFILLFIQGEPPWL
jgi:hypothetical protein